MSSVRSNSEKIVLTDLVSLKTLQKMQDNLANALGISLCLYDVSTQEGLTRCSNMSTFCDKARGYLDFVQGCAKSENDCGSKCTKMRKPFTYKCHADLYGFAVPIMVNGQVVAYFKGGQVRLANPDIEKCRNNAEKYGVDFDEYLESYLALPLFSEDKLDAVIELLSVVANTISHLALSGQIAKNKATEILHLNDLLEKEVMSKTDELRLSERRYRSIFDKALDIIYTLDSNGIILNINNAVAATLGYSRDEIIGQGFGKFVWKEDMQVPKSSFMDLKLGHRQETKGLRFRLKSKDGRPVFFELNSRATYDNDGDLRYIDGILRDIDRSSKMEQDLIMVKEKYKELFDSMRDGIYMTDEEGYIRAFNKGALRILGYRGLEEVIGRPIADMYVDSADRGEFLKELRKEGYVEDYMVQLEKKDGTLIHVEVTSNQLYDKDGKSKGVEGVFRDVTEKVELRQQYDLMKRYMENMIEHAGYGIIGVGLDKKVFVWNKDAEEMFGYKAEEVIGRDISAIVPRDFREHRSHLIKKVMNGEIVRKVIAQRVTKRGERIDISLTLSPIKNSKGKVVGISAISERIDVK